MAGLEQVTGVGTSLVARRFYMRVKLLMPKLCQYFGKRTYNFITRF